MKNVAGSGGKWLDVSPERFAGWVASFGIRHGVSESAEDSGARGDEPALVMAIDGDHVTFTAPDGAVARCHPPFPESLPALDGSPAGVTDVTAITATISAHATAERTVGVLLVRLGGYAVGVFTGYPPALGDAKVGSRPVHGRSAAGGWSQHRFARRREKQVNEALGAAADAAVLIFGGGKSQSKATRLDAVVLGGDRRAVADLRDDSRLAPYFALAAERFLTVPDPKRAVLIEAAKQFTAVRIWLTEP